jgi:hypothetical protein
MDLAEDLGDLGAFVGNHAPDAASADDQNGTHDRELLGNIEWPP